MPELVAANPTILDLTSMMLFSSFLTLNDTTPATES
jgi:hypothetical protein